MTAHGHHAARAGNFWQRLDKGQVIKWTVYVLLFVNWGYYAIEEFYISSHTLSQGGTFLQWTEEFATTIDEFAWFGLLFMFELETYMLGDDAFDKRSVKWSVHGIRLVCYLFLIHTVYARINAVVDYGAVTRAVEVSNLCQVAGQDISFGENFRYEIVDETNCSELSTDSHFYYLEPTVITDSDGYTLERKLLWVDVSDVIVWLLVIWAIELAVWLQNREVTGGRLMVVSHAARLFYIVLFSHAAYWAWNDHWVYAWDQFLWIAGFWAIENNLSEWREEIREELEPVSG